jgi:hypothetical protein
MKHLSLVIAFMVGVFGYLFFALKLFGFYLESAKNVLYSAKN